MFKIKWLNDNRVIGALFSILIVLNAHGITEGWYR